MIQYRLSFLGALFLVITGVATAQTPVSDKKNPEVVYFGATKVKASFEKGAMLAEGDAGQGHYKILTAHRDKPGQAELHTKDTDLIYIVDGTATFVTEGEILEGKTTAPDEIRGSGIKNGTNRHVVKDDVLIVPNGIPHQFVEVSNPFSYYVVKIR